MRDTFCRHADPAAAAVAYGAAFTGRRVALANPPAVFMSPVDFDSAALEHRSGPLPAEWVRWRRPVAPGRYQRLEVGPRDDDQAYLDDIVVRRGAEAVPLSGGFQLMELLSVGSQLVSDIEPVRPLRQEDYRVLEPRAPVIGCGAASSAVCRSLAGWLPALRTPEQALPPVHVWHRRQLLSTTAAQAAPA
jgi:hypothetical protein